MTQPAYDKDLLPLVEGPLHYVLPAGFGRTIVIPPAHRIPTGPNQTAIALEFPDVESSYGCTVIIQDQVLAPGNGYSWQHGIYLVNAWYAKLARIHVTGAGGADTPSMENGIILTGRSNSVSIHGYSAMGMQTALLVAGKSEATRLDDFEFISCYHGIAALTDTFSPGLQVDRGHVRATSAAFLFRHQVQFSVRDVLVYADNGFTQTKTWPFHVVHHTACYDGSFERIQVGSMAPEKAVLHEASAGSDRVSVGITRLAF